VILCRNGHSNPDGSTVCSACGVAIASATAPPPPPPVVPAVEPRVSLSDQSPTVGSGGDARCEVLVENPGAVKDVYTLTLTGQAAEYGVLEPSALTVVGNGSAVSWLTLRPPEGHTPLAFEVKVQSQDTSVPPVSVTGEVPSTGDSDGGLIQKLEHLLPLDDEEEHEEKQEEAKTSVVALVLALAGAAIFAVALFLEQPDGHTFLANDFGGSAEHGGLFTSLAPLSLVIGAVVGALLLLRETTRRVGAGLLVGFGIAGLAKYAGVAGYANSAEAHGQGYDIWRWIPILLGGLVLVAAAVWAIRSTPWTDRRTNDLVPILLALAGAALIVVGCFVPFAHGGPEQTIADRTWARIDPFVTAVAIAAVVFMPRRRGIRDLWFTALIALGIASSLLWVRYIGIPLIRGDSLGTGAIIGLAGSILAIVAGAMRTHLSKVRPVQAVVQVGST
jgi:hypothetical protein